MYAGQPIMAQVVIRNSFHWGSVGYENPEFRMRYDVEERAKDWLVSGRKRGDFIAKVDLPSSHRASLTHIPPIGWRGTRRPCHSDPITSRRVHSTTGDGPSTTYADCARDAERKPSATELGVLPSKCGGESNGTSSWWSQHICRRDGRGGLRSADYGHQRSSLFLLFCTNIYFYSNIYWTRCP